jgi:hypothetical protein
MVAFCLRNEAGGFLQWGRFVAHGTPNPALRSIERWLSPSPTMRLSITTGCSECVSRESAQAMTSRLASTYPRWNGCRGSGCFQSMSIRAPGESL